MSAYIDELYQDNYQTPEEMRLESEVDFQRDELKKEPTECFEAFLDYLSSDSFADNADLVEMLGSMVETAIDPDIANRYKPFNQLVEAAIDWQAKKNALEILK